MEREVAFHHQGRGAVLGRGPWAGAGHGLRAHEPS